MRQGILNMENCVLQCETTGVIVRTSAHLIMKMCDLYGSKVSIATHQGQGTYSGKKVRQVQVTCCDF